MEAGDVDIAYGIVQHPIGDIGGIDLPHGHGKGELLPAPQDDHGVHVPLLMGDEGQKLVQGLPRRGLAVGFDQLIPHQNACFLGRGAVVHLGDDKGAVPLIGNQHAHADEVAGVAGEERLILLFGVVF